MNPAIQAALWRQFSAGVDMLANAIAHCPDAYFASNKRFYYMAYHTSLFLDYYLTVPPADFNPLLPFADVADRPPEAMDDLIPERFYTKEELLAWIAQSRQKAKDLIFSLSDAVEQQRFTEDMDTDAMDYPVFEIILYNLRHVQHHAAQLNLMMRQDLGEHREWVFRGE